MQPLSENLPFSGIYIHVYASPVGICIDQPAICQIALVLLWTGPAQDRFQLTCTEIDLSPQLQRVGSALQTPAAKLRKLN